MNVIGTCGACGGPVVEPTIQFSVNIPISEREPEPPTCRSCGRQPRYPYGPRVEMCEALPRNEASERIVPRREDAVTMAALSDAAEARALRDRNKALAAEVADLQESLARALKGGG